MSKHRFDRNIQLFGKQGQEHLLKTRIAIMGAGGLGSHVISQTALLGVGNIGTVDRKNLSLSNRNRLVGAWHTDSIPGTPKVELAKRHVRLIDPSIEVSAIKDDIVSEASLNELKRADFIIGCVDNDGVRFFLNEACLAYKKTLIDLASDVPEPGKFGGHVAIINGDYGCLYCLDLLDPNEVRRCFSSVEIVENEAAAYGIKTSDLSKTGPSIVSVNGTVASLGVTALMTLAVGLKLPYSFLSYRGDQGTVSRRMTIGIEGCYYCSAIRGLGDQANIERYFRSTGHNL